MKKLSLLLLMLLFSLNLTFAQDEVPELSVDELTNLELGDVPEIPTINSEDLEQLVESTKENEAPPELLEEEIIELQKTPEEKVKELELEKLNTQNNSNDSEQNNSNANSNMGWIYIIILFVTIISIIGFFVFKNMNNNKINY